MSEILSGLKFFFLKKNCFGPGISLFADRINFSLSSSLVKEVSAEECKEIDSLLQYLSEEHTAIKMKKQVSLLNWKIF